jgi:MFS family permease
VRSASDVSRLVNDGSQGRANARIVVGIALGGIFLDAYDLGALAFGIKDITREFNLTPAGTGMVASAITFGAIVGALLGGYLTDKIGRYRVLWLIWCSSWWQRSPVRWPRTNMCSRAPAL